jgi:hypothetical protein
LKGAVEVGIGVSPCWRVEGGEVKIWR